MSDDREARRDFAKLHLALARRKLGIPAVIPELDGPVPLFDGDEDLEDTKGRHPAGGDAT